VEVEPPLGSIRPILGGELPSYEGAELCRQRHKALQDDRQISLESTHSDWPPGLLYTGGEGPSVIGSEHHDVDVPAASALFDEPVKAFNELSGAGGVASICVLENRDESDDDVGVVRVGFRLPLAQPTAVFLAGGSGLGCTGRSFSTHGAELRKGPPENEGQDGDECIHVGVCAGVLPASR
jgi:hypothetical protein